ncbi:hypothetical protein VM1G_11585 [Cytospora mali]|uniref:Uncharacterized protein n=1 Tax=Cytospora mali TaxID=578113 RepID=A0A194VW87_CYTMA|nr:hypothetical protein VM1G_11585 [Valsa mali]
MSGIEIVGLVLGIFPMLVNTSIDIRDVFRDVKTWWFFETEFQGFISTVQTEFIKYSMNLNILLGNLNISEDAKVKLQHDPDCKLWNAPQIQAEIKRRIHQEYWHWFLNHMNDIKGSLAELRKLLPSGERQMLRLKFSFSHRKDKLVGEIRDRNGDIFNFLVQDSLLNRATISSQLKPSRNQASQFLNLKEDAVSLYETLQEHLRCECTSKHPCGVTTSDIDNEQPHDVHIKMLFHDSNVRTQLRIVTVPTIINQAAPRSEPAIENQADNFRQDDPTKCRMRSLRNKTPKALYTLALSSVPSFGSFPHPSLAETDWAIQNEAKLKKLSHPHWFCTREEASTSSHTSSCYPAYQQQSTLR